MAPNSRPPLTSRIRASFDGKRTKSEVTSPTHTNGFITQDPESLRSAIDEAINSETFQKAIAANLAKLIKPSIKSALDTIQPVVEAVYSHELLLRKTNQSVEDILLRLDEKGVTASRRESLVEPLGPEPNDGVPTAPADEGDDGGGKTLTQETPRAVTTSSSDLAQHKKLLEDNHAKTTSSLAELSSNVEVSNGKIAEALQGISDVDTKLRWASDSIDSLKSSSEQSHTTMSVLQAQLDQLKEDIGQLMTAVGSDLGKNVQALSQHGGAQDTSLFDAHTTKLDAISTDIAALKAHSDTVEKIDAVSTELASLKTSVEAGIASNSEGFSGLGSQISTVLTTLEGHTGTLSEIKEKAPHPEILSALQQSNDSHAAHAIALGEIKERSGAAPTPIATDNGSSDSTAALQELKADLASLRENIEAGLTSNNENVTSVGAKVDNVLSTIEGHKASDPSADILAAVQQSNDSHASHTAALDELKSREIAPAAALDTSDLTTQLNAISEAVNAHSSSLDEIKAAGGSHAASLDELKSRELATPSAPLDTSDLTTQLDTLSETINAHTSTLDEIKAASGAHTTALESHGTTLEGLRSTNTVPESVAETEVSNLAPLEAHMSSIVSILEEHSEALNDIKTATGAHTSALESHGTALEDIKSLNKELPSVPVADNSALEAQVAGLATTLESHTSALDEIKSSGSAHAAALEGHGSALESLRSVSSEPASTPSTVDLSGLEGHISAIIATLETHPAALEELKIANGAHTTALEQSRSTSDSVPAADGGNAAALESQINSIVATLQGHSTALEEISAANQSHTSMLGEIDARGQTHASTLDEIKLASTTHASALDELKSPGIPSMGAVDNTSFAALEIQIGSIINTLNVQTAAIKELRPTSSESTEIASPPEGSEGLGGIMTTVVETLEMHTMLLNEMKEDVSAEILTTLHDLSQMQVNQTNLLTEIREADLSDEVLTLLHASGENHTSHAAALEKIEAAVQASNESHVAHASALEEIKAKSVDVVLGNAATVDISGMEAKIDSMVSALEEHKTTLEEIKGTTTTANELHASHTTSLDELKSRTVEPNAAPATVDISEVETKIDHIITALKEHEAVLAEVKDVTSTSHELHTAHGGILDEIKSKSVESQQTSAVDLSGLESQLGAITAALEEHKTALAEVKDLHTAHGVSLDEIKTRSVDLPPALATDLSGLEVQLAAITASLEEHKASLSEMKELHATNGASLAEIKTRSVESLPAPTTDLSGLETQLTAITAALEEHKATLAEVKSTGLASHELHVAHSASLDDIKARSVKPTATAPPIDISSLEAQMGGINSSIDEIKAKSLEPAASAIPVDLSGLEAQLAGLASMLEEHKSTLSEVKATSLASQDMHAAHATSLDEIKSRSIEPSAASPVDLSGLETQLNAISASLEEHKTMLSNITDASLLSNISHTAHTSILSDIKDASTASNESHSAHAAALSDIKDATSSWNEAHSANAFTLAEIKDATLASNESHMSHTVALSELKDGIAQGNEAHASHTAAFADLKSVQPSESSAPTTVELLDLSPIEGHLTSIISTLEGQSSSLAEIKEASSHEDILANISDLKSIISESHAEHGILVKDLHTETKDSHSHLAEAIGALALGGAAGAGTSVSMDDSSKEVLSEVQAMRVVLDGTKEKVESVAAQIDINHTTVTTSITTLSDELKAEIDATGTHVTDHVLSIDLNPLTQSVKTVESKLEGLESSVKQTGSFVVGLYEGVHLNDTGVGQLQEQLVTWVVKGRGAGAETPVESLPVPSDGEKGLQVPIEMDEATWFKKRESKRAVSPSPLREVETVSPPVELEQEQEQEEEEMPNIHAVLEKDVMPAALAAGAVGGAVAIEEAIHEGSKPDPGESYDNVPTIEEPQVEDSPAVGSDTLPLDESKEVEKSAPLEPEAVVSETISPEPLEETTSAEPEISEKEIEQPQESIEPESAEETHASEPSTEVEIPKEIESIAPESVEESASIEEIPASKPSEEPVSAATEPEEKEIEEPRDIGETAIPTGLGESAPSDLETPTEEAKAAEEEPPIVEPEGSGVPDIPAATEESREIEGHIPADTEESTAPDTHEDQETALVEPQIAEDEAGAPHEVPNVSDHVGKDIPETEAPIESNEAEEHPPVQQEEEEVSGVPDTEKDAPVESEIEQAEGPVDTNSSPILESEEEATHLQELESTEPIQEVVEESAPVEPESMIDHASIPETLEEPAPVDPEEPVEHAKEIEEPNHTEPEPTVLEEDHGSPSDEVKDESLEPEDNAHVPIIEEQSIHESEAIEDGHPDHEETPPVEDKHSGGNELVETHQAISPEIEEHSDHSHGEIAPESRDPEDHTTGDSHVIEISAAGDEPKTESSEGEGLEQEKHVVPHDTTEIPVTGEEADETHTEPEINATEEEHADPDSHHVPEELVPDQPSEETTDLGDETPRDPEPTPAEPLDIETPKDDEDSREEEMPSISRHEVEDQATTEEQSEAGGAPIEDIKDDSHISEEAPPSSPFIEEPEAQSPAVHSRSRSLDEEHPALDFEEPHPSPISEHHPSSLVHEVADDDEGIPIATHEPGSPIESHSIPYSGLHADATPLDEEDENPFENPENVISPSDVFSPADVLSPEQEIDEPDFEHVGQAEGHEVEDHSVEGFHEPKGEQDEDSIPSPGTVIHTTLSHHDDEEEEEEEEEESPGASLHEEETTHGAVTHEDVHSGHDASHPTHVHEPESTPGTHDITHPVEDEDESPISHHDSKSTHEDEVDEPHSSPAFSGGFA